MRSNSSAGEKTVLYHCKCNAILAIQNCLAEFASCDVHSNAVRITCKSGIALVWTWPDTTLTVVENSDFNILLSGNIWNLPILTVHWDFLPSWSPWQVRSDTWKLSSMDVTLFTLFVPFSVIPLKIKDTLASGCPPDQEQPSLISCPSGRAVQAMFPSGVPTKCKMLSAQRHYHNQLSILNLYVYL